MHGDIPVITPILSMYLLTTSAVFNPAGHVNILQDYTDDLTLPTNTPAQIKSLMYNLEQTERGIGLHMN